MKRSCAVVVEDKFLNQEPTVFAEGSSRLGNNGGTGIRAFAMEQRGDPYRVKVGTERILEDVAGAKNSTVGKVEALHGLLCKRTGGGQVIDYG